MPDIILITALIIATCSVVTIPITMARHLREDLNSKLEVGEKKFEKIITKLEKLSDNLAKTHADYAKVQAQLDMIIQRGK